MKRRESISRKIPGELYCLGFVIARHCRTSPFPLPMFALARRGAAPRENSLCKQSQTRSAGVPHVVWEIMREFPMALHNQGGSLEFIRFRRDFRHFPNRFPKLNSPKILTCTTDKSRSHPITL